MAVRKLTGRGLLSRAFLCIRLKPAVPAAASLLVALATVAWAGAATDLALYWGGVAVGHWQSVAAVAVAATAWHAALLAMGGPSVFRDCLVFAASASAPVAVYFGSLLGAFLPTLRIAMLAAALPLAALLASFALCATVRRMPAVDAWKKTARPVAYAAAASAIVVSLGLGALGDERCLVVGRPEDGAVSSEEAFDAVVRADLAPASQQGLADAYASFAAAEAAHLGIEAPRLVLRFQPFASAAAETGVDGNEVAVNVATVSLNRADDIQALIHEVFHRYQRAVVDGRVDPSKTADVVASILGEQNAQEWEHGFENYVSPDDLEGYASQTLERDAFGYSMLRAGMLAGVLRADGSDQERETGAQP